MEIVIHGTKLGAKVFTSNKLSGLLDVSPNSPSPSSIGKETYAIRFVENYTILSKYKIIRDVLGDKRTGFVAFSLFVPRNKKLSGIDIINVLDEISKEYCKRYIVDNNLGNVEENWDFINQVKYDLKPVDEHILSGSGDDAYVYFKNQEELQRYFDSPIQEEYKPFRQIYFVDENFYNKPDNPLNALRHNPNSNLTGKIDLDNHSYKLREYHGQAKNGISIEIRANGKLRNNGDKIFRKDNVTIKYSKKYYKDNEPIEGKLYELEAKEYLKISDGSIEIGKIIDLSPIVIPVEIKINDSKGNPITDAEIVCKCKSNNLFQDKELPSNQNIINFSGEEQKEYWIISDKRENFKGEEEFRPEFEFNREVKLTLKEFKTIKLKYLDENNSEIGTKEIPFYDDDISRLQNEPVNIRGYQNKTNAFIPKDVDDPIVIYLEKKINQKSTVQSSDSNSNLKNNPTTDKPRKENNIINYILFGLLACLLAFGAYISYDMLSSNSNTEDNKSNELPKLNPNEIELYAEGDSLFLDKLNKYKEDWAGLKNNTDSAKYEKIHEVINKAIKKREAIIGFDFIFLKDSVKYSDLQQKFKIAVSKIKQYDYEQLRNNLGDVSQLTLTQIADSINQYIEASNEKNSNVEEDDLETKKSSPKSDNNNPEIKKSVQTPKKTISNEEKDIIDYLRGSVFKGNQLREFQKSQVSKILKNSIILALEFWGLDGDEKTKKTYFSYRSKVKKDEYLKENTSLINFLENVTDNNIYPNGHNKPSGAGTTLSLEKFINKTK